MSIVKIIGLVVLALGVVMLVVAWRASSAPTEQITEALTGQYTDNTMVYLLGGVAAVVIGAAMLFSSYARLR